MVKMPLILSLVLLLGACQTATSDNATQSIQSDVDVRHDPLDLNRYKSKIRQGMSKADILALLGTPQWASIPGDSGDFRVRDEDTGLILYWRNPGLGIVEVHFDKDLNVRFDEGNPNDPVSYAFMFEPPVEFECSHPDRKAWCE